MELAEPRIPAGRTELKISGTASGVAVNAAFALGRVWEIELDSLDESALWVSAPAMLQLPGGGVVLPDIVSESGSRTTIRFILPADTRSADLHVLARVVSRAGNDEFRLVRDSAGDWVPETSVVTVVEQAGKVFGVTISMPGDLVFSAFGEPRLVDDLGNEYPLDWRRVGFGKADPGEPYTVVNGVSAARFIGPIAEEATELRLVGAQGGALAGGPSEVVSLALD